MELSRKVVRAMGWDTAGSLVVSAVTFLTTVWLARTLAADGYGLLSALLATVSLGHLVAGGGIRNVLLRFVPQLERDGGPGAVGKLLLTAGIGRTLMLVAVSVPLLAAPEFVAETVLGKQALTPYMRLLPALIALPLYADLFSGTLIALFRQAAVRSADVANKLVFLAGLAAVPFFADPILGVISAWSVAWLCGLLLTALAAHRYGFLSGIGGEVPNLRRLIRYSGTAWGLTLVAFVLGRELDILLLTRFGASNETLARYAIAFAFVNLVYRLPMLPIAGGFDQPLLAGLYSKGDWDGLRRSYNAYFEYTYFFVLPIMGGGLLVAPILLEEIYGGEYAGAGPLVLTLLVSLGLAKLQGITGAFMLATDREHVNLRLRTGAALGNVIAALVCIPLWGPLGAAMATGGTMLLLTVLEVRAVHAYLRPQVPPRFLRGTASGVVAMMMIVAIGKYFAGSSLTLIPLLALIATGAVSYIGMLMVVRPISVAHADLLARGGAGWIASLVRRVAKD